MYQAIIMSRSSSPLVSHTLIVPLLLPACMRFSLVFFLVVRKQTKEKTAPFSVNLMRSQALYRAAQGVGNTEACT